MQKCRKPIFYSISVCVSLYVMYTLMYVTECECDVHLCVFIYYLLIREYKSKDKQVSVSSAM